MPTKEKVIEELSFLSDKISAQVRAVAFGVIVVVWGILFSESSAQDAIFAGKKVQFLFIGSFALIVMFLDFLQYFVGYVYVNNHYKKMKKDKSEGSPYDDNDRGYRWRVKLFWIKQFLLIIILSWFIITILHSLVVLI